MTKQMYRELRLSLIFAIACVVFVWAAGLAKSAEPHPAVVRIVNSLGNVNDIGSGTLIDKTEDGREGIILTCAHLFSDGLGEVTITFPSGDKHLARLIKIDKNADLAALTIGNPKADPPPVKVKTGPQGECFACGYGSNNVYRCAVGPVAGRTQSPGQISLVIGDSVRSGDSGGGVFDSKGRLVAVIWGAADGETYASFGEPLHRFLVSVLGDHAVNLMDCRNGFCTPDATPPVITQQPQLAAKPCDCGDKLAAYEKRIALLESRQPAIGPRGLAGQPGKDGLPGKDAVVGRSVLDSFMPDVLTALMAEGSPTRLPPLTVSQIDATTGERMDSQAVHLGEELPLRFGTTSVSKGYSVDAPSGQMATKMLGLAGGGLLSLPLGVYLAKQILT